MTCAASPLPADQGAGAVIDFDPDVLCIRQIHDCLEDGAYGGIALGEVVDDGGESGRLRRDTTRGSLEIGE